MEACDECKKECLLIHRKRAPSFSKVMTDKSCLQVLLFPPKFARSISHLTDQETYLENSSGLRWRVTVCNHNGSLAIRQGWPEFSSEHGLNVGDLLVFHYVPSEHFLVQIFGTSSCEKIMFCCDIGRGEKRARRLCLDLSSFEMPASNPLAQGTSSRDNGNVETNLTEPHLDDSETLLPKFEAGTDMVCKPAEDIPPLSPEYEKSEEASQFDSGEEYASESDDSEHPPSRNTDEYSCLVLVDGSDFQELPESWRNLFKRPKRGRWIIFLQGLDKRIWPVFYLTRSGFDDVLTCGWKQVTAAYGLNAGDFCLFELVNKQEHIFGVRKI